MRILHLPENYASRVFHQVNALRLRGHQSRTCIYTYHPSQRDEGLRVFGRAFPCLYQKNRFRSGLLRGIMSAEFMAALPWAEVVHWYTGGKVLWLPGDVGLTRLFKRKKIVHWQGDDLRDPFVEVDLNPAYARVCTAWTRETMRRQSKVNRMRQKIFLDAGFTPLTPIELEDHLLGEWRDKSMPIRHTVDTHDLIPSPREPDGRIRIAHAPTESVVKGTKYILESLEKLQQSYPVDIVLLTGLPRQKVMEAVQSSDIFVDQMVLGMYGMASLEAMSLGVPAVCHVCDRVRKKAPEDLPVINATADTLTDVLADLIARRDEWPDIARRGREYVEKYHSYAVMGAYLEEVYHRVPRV